MTRIGIVGGGRAATLHAEAARAARGVTLVGVGGRSPGTAGPLTDALGVPDLPLVDLAAAADGLVVAVPPPAVAGVVERVPDDLPLLIESPGAVPADRPSTMTAVNLLHAPTVAAGLRAIAELGPVHHLVLRGRGPRPSWGAHRDSAWGGVVVDPHAATVPVLLAAAGAPVVDVTGRVEGPFGLPAAVDLGLALADGRSARLDVAWTDDPSAGVELEAAGATGVVTLRLLPHPDLEIDGRPATEPEGSGAAEPLVALGFVAQMARFAGVIRGDRPAWPPVTVGGAVWTIEAAASALLDG